MRLPAVLDVAVLGLEGEVEEVRRAQREEDGREEPEAEGGPELGGQQHEQVVALDGELGHAERVDGGDHEQGLARHELVEQAEGLDEDGDALDRRGAADVAAHLVQVLRDARGLVRLAHLAADLGRVPVDLAGDLGRRGRERHVGGNEASARSLWG